MADIHWEQAYNDYEENKKSNPEKVREILEEIKCSDFSLLDALDVYGYVDKLNTYRSRKEEYTANEVRRINMNAQDYTEFHLLNSFTGDDSDDIMDFY